MNKAAAEPLDLWLVDAFATEQLAGNRAGVMLLDREYCAALDARAMHEIARKSALPALAFLAPSEGGDTDYSIRWFGVSGEIALCGHGALASADLLLEMCGRDSLRMVTRGGVLIEARRKGQACAIALPTIRAAPCELAEAARLLGVQPAETAHNGQGYWVFRFKNEESIRALKPDFSGLARLGRDQFICSAPGESYDIVSRVFVPGAGVDEDQVTGSAHAALAPFWAKRLGRSELTALQASPRGGALSLGLEGERVWLGGQCLRRGKSTIHLGG